MLIKSFLAYLRKPYLSPCKWLQVLGAAYPWIARRLLTDSNPELQDTLRVLLYKGNSFQFSRLESLLQQALKSPARLSRIQPTAPPRNPTQPGPSKAWGNRFATRQPQTNNPSQMRQQPPVVEPTQMGQLPAKLSASQSHWSHRMNLYQSPPRDVGLVLTAGNGLTSVKKSLVPCCNNPGPS